jgi:hypothetical protein
MFTMQAASAQAHQNFFSLLLQKDIFSFCVGIFGYQSTYFYPRKIWRKPINIAGIVTVGITIVVHITKVSGIGRA